MPALMTALGIVLVQLLLVLCVVGLLVWHYNQSLAQRVQHQMLPPANDTPTAQQPDPLDEYQFSAVPVNTRGWVVYQPLIGFSFSYPRDLSVNDTGPQKVMSDGGAAQYRNLQTVTLVASGTTHSFPNGIVKGMLYTLIIDLDDNNLPIHDLCQLYTTGMFGYTDGSHTVCEIRKTNNDYTYVTKHGARSYSMELEFPYKSTPQQRNAYISQAHQIIHGFTFAN